MERFFGWNDVSAAAKVETALQSANLREGSVTEEDLTSAHVFSKMKLVP